MKPVGGDDAEAQGGYDFWVFNWHFVTMAFHIDLPSIGRVPGPKFCILLEVEPENPLRHVAVDVFDGYIALDPSTPAVDKIVPFPRPLPGEPRQPVGIRDVPVISSFGFGTPGKGFSFLVEAVNREFDEAVVRINVPSGTYTGGCDNFHGTSYPDYLASLCRRIAKPGIEIRFTHDFMTPDELLDWCTESDLNCFLYTRRQAGLSATTDQCILSGRPLVTGTNDTFRHIHKYIPPYPVISLRQALETTVPAVHRLQQDWSSAAFVKTFERMLASFGITELSAEGQNAPAARPVRRIPLLVLSLAPRSDPGILSYETRLADCLGRSGTYDVRLVEGADLPDFVNQNPEYRPAAVVVTGFDGDTGDLARALAFVTGPKILLRDGEPPEGRNENGITVLPRRPIIPYYTTGGVWPSCPRIRLIGFTASSANLDAVMEKIGRDLGEADVVVEAPEVDRARMEAYVSAPDRAWSSHNLRVSVQTLPNDAEMIINGLVATDAAVVCHYDESRARELENFACLALAMERPVVFTRAAPFPQFGDLPSYVEDLPFADILTQGVAAHIALYAECGEWRTFAAINQVLVRKIRSWPATGTLDSLPALDGDIFLDTAYHAVLGRTSDTGGFAHFLAKLNAGASKTELVGDLFLSPEGLAYQTNTYQPIVDIENLPLLEGEAFVDAAYRAVLGHAPDPGGLAYHLKRLNDGASKAELVGSLFLSQEGLGYQTCPPEPASGVTGLADLQGEAFIDAAYRSVLNRVPDPDGFAYHTARLKGGGSKAELVGTLFLAPEGELRRATVLGQGIGNLLAHEEGAFVDAAYRAVLGRPSDPNGHIHNLNRLRNGVSKIELVGDLFLSPEGLTHQAAVYGAIPSASGLLTLERAVPADASAPPEPEAPAVEVPPEPEAPAVEVPPEPEAPVPVVLRETTVGRRIFVLVEAADAPTAGLSNVVLGLGRDLLAQDEALRFVRWSPGIRKFVLLTRNELSSVPWPPHSERHLKVHPVLGEAPVILDEPFAGNLDWLLVPGPVRVTPSLDYLFETDLIIEARRLRLGSAFVFRNADPLRRAACAGNEAKAFELYMQALLLADVVVPISTIAENDLIGFFTQHQCADRIPLIRRIPLSSAESSAPARLDTADAVRRLRGLLSEAADRSRGLASLYYCLDATGVDRADAVFAQRLARAFVLGGIDVIPAAWDSDKGRLAAVPADDPVRLNPVGEPTVAWAEWIDPQSADAPRWVLLPGNARGKIVEGVGAFARAHGLRTAAILTRTGTGGSHLEHLAGCDKVFCASSSAFDELYRFLLSWRRKLLCAEDRFTLLESPNEVLERARRGAPKRSAQGVVRIHAVAEAEHSTHFDTLIAAAGEVAKQSSRRLVLTVFGRVPVTHGNEPGEHAGFDLRYAPEASSIAGSGLEDADVVVSLGSGAGIRAPAVIDSQWRGIPCLVLHDGLRAADRGPGLVLADASDMTAVRDAILKLLDEEWRGCLAREALAQPVRSWNGYVRDIAAALASDRLAETLHVPQRQVRRDLYAALPNLQRRPKLSLCISTYKRAGWVALNLKNIFAQIGSPRPDLEVLVVDNTSPDNTPEVVKPYLDRPDFTYMRNPKNVGMLGNLAVTAQRARGEYIWIIGDDDLTRSGTIERVLHILDQHPGLGVIYMNYGYSSEPDPTSIADLPVFLDGYNTLEPPGPDEVAPVKRLAAKSENFFTAIYSHVYRRDHGLRSYCQDTSGRIFATMVSCVPTAYYVLCYMADETAYWIGEPSLVVNSNVSWAAYGPMLDLEHLPRSWDLAERGGCDPAEVDRRRANRLWLVEMMWRDLFENDAVGNSNYISPPQVLMRLKHLSEIDPYIPNLRAIYDRAYQAGHPAAALPTEELFSAFGG